MDLDSRCKHIFPYLCSRIPDIRYGALLLGMMPIRSILSAYRATISQLSQSRRMIMTQSFIDLNHNCKTTYWLSFSFPHEIYEDSPYVNIIMIPSSYAIRREPNMHGGPELIKQNLGDE